MSNVVAILYDIENSSLEMLNYAIKCAKKYSLNIKVVSDWQMTFSKYWNGLLARKDLTFVQVERKNTGKNSLDYALFDAAISLQNQGVQRFFIVTTDTDFTCISEHLHEKNPYAYIIGIGGICCSIKLRDSYNEFLYYPPEIAKKILSDRHIPEVEPIDEVRECLLKAYLLVTQKKKWISMHQFGQAFKNANPNYSFPKGHPSKLRCVIKIYQSSFEWKRNGNITLVKLKDYIDITDNMIRN